MQVILTMAEWRRYRRGMKPLEDENARLRAQVDTDITQGLAMARQIETLTAERDALKAMLPGYDDFVKEMESMREEVKRMKDIREAQVLGTRERAIAESNAVALAREETKRWMNTHAILVAAVKAKGLDPVEMMKAHVLNRAKET